MKTIDIRQLKNLNDYFPELTPDQLETGMLFSMGISKKEIAFHRSVTYSTVNKMLDTIKQKFEVGSLTQLLSVFQSRLYFIILIKITQQVEN
ncbi:transcriptional regulator [Arsenophonus sp. aPb]|uniref:helix-turn-helix transcriptional regulator n=1 Tax=Arsenophonus sp. aPb TaxID=3041619 RepID=UPI002469138B|nr:transcriptional regulator [Arsenophonus sp. aPb]WGL98660.1 transcriptional regulator [Arsenophonus sp. aPb]